MSVLLEASLRITVVAGVVAFLLMLWRVRSGQVRHAAWTIVVAAMLLMPALSALLPSITVPTPLGSGARMAATIIAPDWPAAGEVLTSAQVTQPPVSFVTSSTPAITAVSGERAPAVGTHDAIRDVVVAVYAMGVLLMVARGAIGWRRAARLSRYASAVPLGCGAPVRESSLVATPLTAGVFRPAIILPAAWKGWSEDKLRACLAHELSHVRRRDALVAFLAHVNRCVFWFHPLAWWLPRVLASAAEDAADEAA